MLAGVTVPAMLDAGIGSMQGNILYRGSSAWSVLVPGTAGQYLSLADVAITVAATKT